MSPLGRIFAIGQVFLLVVSIAERAISIDGKLPHFSTFFLIHYGKLDDVGEGIYLTFTTLMLEPLLLDFAKPGADSTEGTRAGFWAKHS